MSDAKLLKLNITEETQDLFRKAVMKKHGCLAETVDGKKVGYMSMEGEEALRNHANKILSVPMTTKETVDLDQASREAPSAPRKPNP